MRTHEIPDEVSKIIDWASDDIHRDEDTPSWSPYNRGEQFLTVWAVVQGQGIIDNGGFQYFFENDWPKNPPYSVFADAFRRVGAVEAADWIEDIVEMFPSKNPHLDHKMRRDYMDALQDKDGGQDSVIDNLGGRVIDLGGDTFIRLAKYILANIDFFPTAKKNVEKGIAADLR